MGENGQNDNTKYNENAETGTSSVKNQQQQQTQSQQQRQQTTTNRFADYFVICGLDLDTGLEPDRFAGTYNYTFIAIFKNQNFGCSNFEKKNKICFE